MKIGKIIKYGLYNSKKVHLGVKQSPKRTTVAFEFDYVLSCSNDAASHVDDKHCKLSPNMLIVRKPDQESFSQLHFKCYCLHLKLEKDSPFYQQLLELPTYFTLINENTYQPLFETLFHHIVQAPEYAEDCFTASKLLELFYHLDKDAKRNKNVTCAPAQKENAYIKTAIEFMKKHFHEKITLQTLGNLTGYTPNHFQRIFTEVMEISPQKYLENLRIEHAKYLLAKNETSLADIAYLCGFSTQPYFSQLFKRTTLLSPSEFRNNAKFRH